MTERAEVTPAMSTVSVLIADDDATSRRALATVVRRSGWEPVVVDCGSRALDLIVSGAGPRVALVDWMMPDLSGVELCRRVRERDDRLAPYLIVVTVKQTAADIAMGLDAGADDYLVKPVNAAELRARVQVGHRTVDLRDRLVRRAAELEAALSEVRQLRSLLPTCSYCRRIRDERHAWQTLEEYVCHNTDVKFSHGYCPQCYDEFVRPQLERHPDPHRVG